MTLAPSPSHLLRKEFAIRAACFSLGGQNLNIWSPSASFFG
jgi:hypothetical protein